MAVPRRELPHFLDRSKPSQEIFVRVRIGLDDICCVGIIEFRSNLAQDRVVWPRGVGRENNDRALIASKGLGCEGINGVLAARSVECQIL